MERYQKLLSEHFLNSDIKKIIYGDDVIEFRITTMMRKIIDKVKKPPEIIY